MRNLKLRCNAITNIESEGKCHVCIDPITKVKYIVNCDGLYTVGEKSGADSNEVSKKWIEADILMTKIVLAEVIPSLSSICVVSEEGDVVIVYVEDSSIDIVGNVIDGILAADWSPDQGILTLVTKSLSVILMTVEFETIAELSLNREQFGEKEFINVGWGKKETQFHGREGKQAAKDGKKQSTSAFDWDSKEAKITWRGDGQLFAVSYINSYNVRKFRVINREGVMQSTSEDLEGLEDCLSWKPSGNLIASSQRLSNKHNIIFFEKNGLQHGGFSLPFGHMEMKVEGIFWNQDSSILLVWLEPFQDNNNKSLIQLWRVGNYHWYLKEELRFTEKLNDLKWDSEHPHIFYLLFSKQIYDLQFVNSVDFSKGSENNDTAQVAVVDGNKLLMTPFNQAVVPPPMSAYEIIFTDQIHSIMYAPSQNEKASEASNKSIEDSGFLENAEAPGSNYNNVCVYHGQHLLTFLTQALPQERLSDYGIEVKVTAVGGTGYILKTIVHRVFAQCKIDLSSLIMDTEDSFSPVSEDSFSPVSLYNWNWVSKHTLISCCNLKSKNYIIIFDIEGIENGKLSIKNISLKNELASLSPSPDGSFVCLQLLTGELQKLHIDNEVITPWIENNIALKFPTVCDQVFLCPANGTFIPLGLTSRNRLYLGSTQILSDCTSVHLHVDHVLISTTSHKLLVVPMNFEALKSLSAGIQNEFSEIGTRRLERGSRIVTAVASDTKVLLQMPRGNLEMINPRPLVVHRLKRLLDEKNYRKVIEIMRVHRLDMNLLYDHNPSEFVKNVEHFVRNVDNPQWIDLFISSLKNVDVTQTYYSNNYSCKSSDTISKGNKIDTALDALRMAMLSVDEEKYLLPILSSYVHATDGKIKLALMKLKEMKEDNKINKSSFEDGLKHIMYVCDANELCDIALGTYDFDLVMLVFEKSQRDPREFLPFLNSLLQLEEKYRKFKINVHLKQYSEAFECMNNCDNKYYEECLALIKKEKLYKLALNVLKSDSPIYKSTCDAYGDYLLGKDYKQEAATMYECGSKLDAALNIYMGSNKWKNAFILAHRLKYSPEHIRHLYTLQVEALKNEYSYGEAAIIYDKYIHHEENAVECYCLANQWEEALLLAYKYDREDLIETIITPSVLGHYVTLSNEVKEMESKFKELLNRLKEVRMTKKEEYLDFLEGKFDTQLDSDLYSDASTVTGISHQRSNFSKAMSRATSASGNTYRSSKNKRKLDRKKHSTKKGSFFEDLGLIVELHTLMNYVESVAKGVLELNKVLIRFAKKEQARSLQILLYNLIQEMQKSKFIIWLNCAPVEDEAVEFGPQMTAESAVRQIRENGTQEKEYFIKRMNELEPHYRFPPNLDKISDLKLYLLQ